MKNKITKNQIVGVITKDDKIYSVKSNFKNPVHHRDKWNNEEKRWIFNLYDNIQESELSEKLLSEKDIKNIQNHLYIRYNIFFNNEGLFDVQQAKSCLNN